MTSATASATSAATSARRIRLRPAPAVRRSCRLPSTPATVASGARCSSGASPNTAPRRQPDDEREREDAEIERDVRRTRQAVRIGRNQRAHADDARRPGPSAAPANESRQPFDHELTQQPPASRAERGADRELLVPRFGAREQQVGQVRARDQQHEDDRALQHEHGGPRAADNLHLQRVEPQTMVLRVRRVRTVASTPAARAIDDGQPASSVSSSAFALSQRRAVGQPANQIQKVTAAVLPVRRDRSRAESTPRRADRRRRNAAA